MNDKNKKGLIDKLISSYNAFDIDGMMSVLHSDIEFKNISNGEVTASTSGEMEFRKKEPRCFLSRMEKYVKS